MSRCGRVLSLSGIRLLRCGSVHWDNWDDGSISDVLRTLDTRPIATYQEKAADKIYYHSVSVGLYFVNFMLRWGDQTVIREQQRRDVMSIQPLDLPNLDSQSVPEAKFDLSSKSSTKPPHISQWTACCTCTVYAV